MERVFQDLLNDIPDYQEFLTLEELNESSKRLAAAYPSVVELFEIGRTRNNRPLLCLKIGKGSKNALMFGCPHPNEPIGTMMLEHFTEALARDEALRRELDYTFYIVKVWDADGYAMNAGWIKGPYTLYNYSRHFYRPASNLQVDWTFPIDYKDLHFHDVMPETQAMKDLIDRIRPTFTYALHNSGFGGVYWYVTEDIPEVYPLLAEASLRQGIPLHLGEPESPAIVSLAPAVCLAEGIESEYDYYEKYGAQDIPKIIKSGTCSDAYSKQAYGTFTFLTEMPYFYDARINDSTPSKFTRSEAVLRKLDWLEESTAGKTVIDMSPLSSGCNLFIKVVGNIRMVVVTECTPYGKDRISKIATVAEYFDSVCISFLSVVAYGGWSVEFNRRAEGAAVETLRSGLGAAEELHGQLAAELEEEFDYSVIPIKKLATIQLECGIRVAKYIHNR